MPRLNYYFLSNPSLSFKIYLSILCIHILSIYMSICWSIFMCCPFVHLKVLSVCRYFYIVCLPIFMFCLFVHLYLCLSALFVLVYALSTRLLYSIFILCFCLFYFYIFDLSASIFYRRLDLTFYLKNE